VTRVGAVLNLTTDSRVEVRPRAREEVRPEFQEEDAARLFRRHQVRGIVVRVALGCLVPFTSVDGARRFRRAA